MTANKFSSLLFGSSTNLADHHNGIGLWIFLKQSQRIDKVCSNYRVSADPDRGRLTEPKVSKLMNSFVSESSTSRHDAYAAFSVNMTRHDSDLAFAGRDDSGTIRTNQSSFSIAEIGKRAHHIQRRDSFGDAHCERKLSVGGFHYRVGGKRRWNVDYTRVGASLSDCISEGIENGDAVVFGAAFSRRHAGNNLSAVCDHLSGVKGSLFACDSLNNNARILIDEYAHSILPNTISLTITTAKDQQYNTPDNTPAKTL